MTLEPLLGSTAPYWADISLNTSSELSKSPNANTLKDNTQTSNTPKDNTLEDNTLKVNKLTVKTPVADSQPVASTCIQEIDR
jgi:hypothetical protein